MEIRERSSGIILDHDEPLVLMTKRYSTNPWQPGKWELPGGRLDGNETPQKCFEREMKEELDINVDDCFWLMTINDLDFEDKVIWKTNYFVATTKTFTGDIKALEAEEFRWWNMRSIFNMDPNIFVPFTRAAIETVIEASRNPEDGHFLTRAS